MAATVRINTATLPKYSGCMPPDTHSHTCNLPVKDRPEKNMDILHANWSLCRNTSSKTHLEIELSPLAWEWMRISLGTNRYQSSKTVIADEQDARKQGLYDLPFEQIDEVAVRLYAPTSDNPGQSFILFDKVVNLVDMLRCAPAIEKISIVLEALHEQEWHHESVTIGGVKESFFVPWADDCDLMVVPFCSLKNVGGVCVHARSKELEWLIDWSVIDWAVGVVRDRSWQAYIPDPARARATRRFDTTTYYASYTHRPDRSTPGTDVDRKVAEYYLRVHVNLMRHDFRDTGRHQRRDLLKRSFAYNSATTMTTSPSSFERDMMHISENYPDLLRKYDRAIEVLLHMQRIIVCAYDRTKPAADTDNYTDTMTQFDSWNEAAWELVERAFGDPLPNMGSWVFEGCAMKLGSLVDYNECLERVTREGEDWLMGIVRAGQFMQDWVRVFVYGESGEEDEDEYGEEYGYEEDADEEYDDVDDVDEDEEREGGDEDDEEQGKAEDEKRQEDVKEDEKEDNNEGEVEDEESGDCYEADDVDWVFCEYRA